LLFLKLLYLILVKLLEVLNMWDMYLNFDALKTCRDRAEYLLFVFNLYHELSNPIYYFNISIILKIYIKVYLLNYSIFISKNVSFLYKL